MKNSEFIIGKVPITKEEVRSISIAKLELSRAKKFIDIGSGTGSITVEAGLNYPNLKVASVETNELAYELTKKNILKFELENITQIKAMAPINIDRFEKVDAIFLGGTKDNLKEILEWSYETLREGGKIVSNFILIDNFYSCREIMKEIGFKKLETVQLSVSRLEKLGKGEYFKPENPIFILSGEK